MTRKYHGGEFTPRTYLTRKGKKPKGWVKEPGRHAAAARGIETAIQTIKRRKFGAVGKPVYDIANLEDTLVILEDHEKTGMDMSGSTNDVLNRLISYYEDERWSEQRDFDLAALEDTKDILDALRIENREKSRNYIVVMTSDGKFSARLNKKANIRRGDTVVMNTPTKEQAQRSAKGFRKRRKQALGL